MSILTWNRPFLRRTAYEPVHSIYRDEEMVLYAWRMDVVTQIVFYVRVHPHDLEESRLYITAGDEQSPRYKPGSWLYESNAMPTEGDADAERDLRRWYASTLPHAYFWFSLETPFVPAPPYVVDLAATERVGRASSNLNRAVALALFARVQSLQRALLPPLSFYSILPNEEEVFAFLRDPLNSPIGKGGRMRNLTEYDRNKADDWSSPYMLLHAREELQKYGPPAWILGR